MTPPSPSPPTRAPLVLFLRRARRGRDNRILDIAIGVVNSVGRPLVVYVEPAGSVHPAWLAELADSLWLRSIGLVYGAEADREQALKATGASALLYEGEDEPVSSLPTMRLETVPIEKIVADDRVPSAFWEKVSRAAHFALPVATRAPTLWVPFAVASPRLARTADPPAEESTVAADSLLVEVCHDALRDRDAIARLAVAVAAGMLPIERAVQAIVVTTAPRVEQEDALITLWPPLRALRSMP